MRHNSLLCSLHRLGSQCFVLIKPEFDGVGVKVVPTGIEPVLPT